MVQQVPPPKRKPRHDEWTREKMAGFLRELAATQSVAAAARSVGMSRTSALRQAQDRPFEKLRTGLQGARPLRRHAVRAGLGSGVRRAERSTSRATREGFGPRGVTSSPCRFSALSPLKKRLLPR